MNRPLLLLLLLLIPGPPAAGDAGRTDRDSPLSPADRRAVPSVLPLSIEPNRGQAGPSSVAFHARARGVHAWFLADRVVFSPASGPGVVEMTFPGSSPEVSFEPLSATGAVSNYYRGGGELRRIEGVPQYAGLRARGLHPGADLRWYDGGDGSLRYDVLLAPGVDPSVLGMSFPGCGVPEVEADGGLLVATDDGELRFSRPRLHQERGGDRLPLEGGFVVRDSGVVGFLAEGRDPTLALVIDPVVSWSSYLGGGSPDNGGGTELNDQGLGVHFDAGGAACIAGATKSPDFPVVGNPLDFNDREDAFVARLVPGTGGLLFSTFLGGNVTDRGTAIRADSTGRLVAAGCTNSPDFPVTAGVVGPTRGGYSDGFVASFDPVAGTLGFSTYVGSNGDESIFALALDGDDVIHVAGRTNGGDGFPFTENAAQIATYDNNDAFVMKLSSDGTAVLYGTRVGGNDSEAARSIDIAPDGSICVAGWTRSTDIATPGAAQETNTGGYEDAFAAVIIPDGTAFAWRTFIGGGRVDDAEGVRFASNGDVFVAGSTQSSDFPLVNQFASSGGADSIFITRIAAEGDAFVQSSRLGGNFAERCCGMDISPAGEPVLVGWTKSHNFPVMEPIQSTLAAGLGDRDGFILVVKPDGSGLSFSTYYGGGKEDFFRSVSVDSTGAVLAGGCTSSLNFPLKSSYQDVAPGQDDSMLVLLRPVAVPLGLAAVPFDSSRIDVSWVDASTDETGFELQRKNAEGAWIPLAELSPGTESYSFRNCQGSTTYTFRIRSLKGLLHSEWAPEASATTPPGPPGVPESPGLLTVDLVGTDDALLTWIDASETEDFFHVNRKAPGGDWETLRTVPTGETTFLDEGLGPDRTYSYSVRAGNVTGLSQPANFAEVTTPGDLLPTLLTGRIVDSSKMKRDSMVLTLRLAGESGAADLPAGGLSLYLRGWEGQRLLAIPPGDEGWIVKKGKATWKSPKDSITKVKLTVQLETGILQAKLSRLQFLEPPADPLPATFETGGHAGTVEGSWFEKKPGKWYLVP